MIKILYQYKICKLSLTKIIVNKNLPSKITSQKFQNSKKIKSNQKLFYREKLCLHLKIIKNLV